MSTASIPRISWPDRASDWLNPILVKETRQALKSRQFIATFFLLLIAAWLTSTFALLFASDGAEFRRSGPILFSAFYMILAVAIFIIVPFAAFRSLLSERDQFTYEVLSITTLSPRQIVWGKLCSSIVQIFIYYSAITPFLAFSLQFKGVNVRLLGLVLVSAAFGSLGLSMAALAVSTAARHRALQVLLTLGVLAGLLFAFSMNTGMCVSLIQERGGMPPMDDSGFWWGCASLVSYFIAYFLLLMELAIAQLTFDADNRSSWVRLGIAGLFWMSVAWVAGAFIWWPTIIVPEMALTFMGLAIAHWGILGLFAVTEHDALSRRVRRNLLRFGVFRVVLTPLMPGGARGLLFLLIHIPLTVIFCLWMLSKATTSVGTSVDVLFGLTGYLIIYLCLGAFLARLSRRLSGEMRPSHARVFMVLIVALGAIFPQLLNLLNLRQATIRPIFFITDPFTTLMHLSNGEESGLLVALLMAAAGIGVLVNLPAMFRGVVEVAMARLPPPMVPAMPPVEPMASAGANPR